MQPLFGTSFTQAAALAPCIQLAAVEKSGQPNDNRRGLRVRKPSMAKNTGKGSRKGAVKGRTQVKNPRTKDYTKRNESSGSSKRGKFMDVKEDRKPFKGVAKEPDKRRKKSSGK